VAQASIIGAAITVAQRRSEICQSSCLPVKSVSNIVGQATRALPNDSSSWCAAVVAFQRRLCATSIKSCVLPLSMDWWFNFTVNRSQMVIIKEIIIINSSSWELGESRPIRIENSRRFYTMILYKPIWRVLILTKPLYSLSVTFTAGVISLSIKLNLLSDFRLYCYVIVSLKAISHYWANFIRMTAMHENCNNFNSITLVI
jgi:hypothetical protein